MGACRWVGVRVCGDYAKRVYPKILFRATLNSQNFLEIAAIHILILKVGLVSEDPNFPH